MVILVVVVIAAVMLISGCLNYKTDSSDGVEVKDNADLVSEIAQVEEELGLSEGKSEVEGGEELLAEEPAEAGKAVEEPVPAVEEEVVLPELKEEETATAETTPEGDIIINVKENEAVRLKVKVTDPDRDVVSYNFSKPLNSKGEWKTNYGDAGEYFATISASDGVRMCVLIGKYVPPALSLLKDVVIKEGETVNFKPNITDPNGDKVTVTVSEPLSTGSFKTDHTSAGEYQITVSATDGELTTERTFKLTVVNVNMLPEIEGVVDLKVKEGAIVKIEPVVKDLDEDQVTVTISEPVGDSGEWKTDYNSHGEYPVTVTAFDGRDRVTKKIKVTIEDVNMPPEIVDVSLLK